MIDQVRRLAAVLIVVALALLLFSVLLWQTHLPVPLFEDWRWYHDGPDRLRAGMPLYDAAFLHGTFDQSDPQIIGKYDQWPAFAVALLPFDFVVPDELQMMLWGILTTAMLVVAFALVWPRGAQSLTATALILIVALAPATWLGFRTANMACAVALGVALTIVGQRRGSTALMASGVLLAGIAKILPALPLGLWLIARHRQWRPVAIAVAAGAVLTGIAMVLAGPSIIGDFWLASTNRLPLDQWTNVAPARLLAPWLGSLAEPVSLVAAAVLVALALRRGQSDGGSLLLLTIASCLVLPTTHFYWWLGPMVVLLAYYGDRIVHLLGRLFDWRTGTSQSAGSSLT